MFPLVKSISYTSPFSYSDFFKLSRSFSVTAYLWLNECKVCKCKVIFLIKSRVTVNLKMFCFRKIVFSLYFYFWSNKDIFGETGREEVKTKRLHKHLVMASNSSCFFESSSKLAKYLLFIFVEDLLPTNPLLIFFIRILRCLSLWHYRNRQMYDNSATTSLNKVRETAAKCNIWGRVLTMTRNLLKYLSSIQQVKVKLPFLITWERRVLSLSLTPVLRHTLWDIRFCDL